MPGARLLGLLATAPAAIPGIVLGVGRAEREDRHRRAFHGDKFYLPCGAIRVAVDHSTHLPLLQAMLGNVMCEHDHIQFPNHRLGPADRVGL